MYICICPSSGVEVMMFNATFKNIPLSGVLAFTSCFKWGSCYSICSFMCMLCRSFLFCFFWPLCCVSFFDLRITDYPLVSSKSSYCQFKLSSVYRHLKLSSVYCQLTLSSFFGRFFSIIGNISSPIRI